MVELVQKIFMDYPFLGHPISLRNGPKLQIRTISKRTKIANSDRNRLFFTSKVLITCPVAILVHFQIVQICNFGPFRLEIEWTKIAFSKQTEHVILNSFKHFSGPKIIVMTQMDSHKVRLRYESSFGLCKPDYFPNLLWIFYDWNITLRAVRTGTWIIRIFFAFAWRKKSTTTTRLTQSNNKITFVTKPYSI